METSNYTTYDKPYPTIGDLLILLDSDACETSELPTYEW